MAVKAIPDGFTTATCHLTVKGASDAMAFYQKAFGAEEIMRMPGPDGQSVMHGEIKIGNSIIMLNDEFPGQGPQAPSSLNGTTSVVHLYVEDADAFYDKAVKAGATAAMPLTDMFWGDRYGSVVDPFGHMWSIATHTEDLTPQQIGERAAEWMKNMPDCG